MSIIFDVKQKLDIVEVISEYVHLERAGQNFKALCPFHSEKTPSFFVFPEKQIWRCFGCNSGGDAFAFVMKKEGVDFKEALRILARKAGVSLNNQKQDKRIERFYEINKVAARHYHDLLLNSPAAQIARDYVKKRGLNEETVKEFKLGFSLDSWAEIKQYLLKRDYKEEELVTAGLLVQKEEKTYDRFRGRLMFPVRNFEGKIVGFGARALDNSEPKYLNSPETPVFDKGSILYGIEKAVGAIHESPSPSEKKVVLVEGYMDVLTAHQWGFKNVVATMGTALTPKHVRTLRRLTKSLVLALDPDTAGDLATLRDIGVLRNSLKTQVRETRTLLGETSKLSAEIKIASLPRGKDPDDLIKENPATWRHLIDEALPLIEFLFLKVNEKFDISKPDGKTKAAKELLPFISEMENDVEREFYFRKLSQLLKISERALTGMEARLQLQDFTLNRVRAIPEAPLPSLGDPLEEHCLSLLLQHPELREKAEGLSPEYFERSENREIYLAWQRFPDFKTSLENLDPNLRKHFNSLLSREIPSLGEMEQERALADILWRLKERQLRAQVELLTMEEESLFSSKEACNSDSGLLRSRVKEEEINGKLVEGWSNGGEQCLRNQK